MTTQRYVALFACSFFALCPLFAADAPANPAPGTNSLQLTLTTNWTDLFSGSDLSGWDKHLSRTDGKEIIPNEDPKNVFSVTNLADGPAIHVTGEVYGAITTQSEFENFHFRVDFRWGEKTLGTAPHRRSRFRHPLLRGRPAESRHCLDDLR